MTFFETIAILNAAIAPVVGDAGTHVTVSFGAPEANPEAKPEAKPEATIPMGGRLRPAQKALLDQIKAGSTALEYNQVILRSAKALKARNLVDFNVSEGVITFRLIRE